MAKILTSCITELANYLPPHNSLFLQKKKSQENLSTPPSIPTQLKFIMQIVPCYQNQPCFTWVNWFKVCALTKTISRCLPECHLLLVALSSKKVQTHLLWAVSVSNQLVQQRFHTLGKLLDGHWPRSWHQLGCRGCPKNWTHLRLKRKFRSTLEVLLCLVLYWGVVNWLGKIKCQVDEAN